MMIYSFTHTVDIISYLNIKEIIIHEDLAFSDAGRGRIKWLMELLFPHLLMKEPNAVTDHTLSFPDLSSVAEAHSATILPRLQVELAREVTASDWNDLSRASSGSVDWEVARDRLAIRQAGAAVAIFLLGDSEVVWSRLGLSADPRLRSFIVSRLRPGKRRGLDLDAPVLSGSEFQSLEFCATKLEQINPGGRQAPTEGHSKMDAVLFDSASSLRRALILVLGSFSLPEESQGTRARGVQVRRPEEWLKKQRNDRERLIAVQKRLVDKLLDGYRNDPDAGIHGALEWTLRRWKQQDKLKAIDAELSKIADRGERRWYVNGQRQTFAVIDGPVELRVGSPLHEPGRVAGQETQHRIVIPRRFAIATKEVTVEQFQRFLRSHPQFRLGAGVLKRFSPEPLGPWIAADWYGAAAYCNWLSEQEGIPKDQWCYVPNQSGEYAEGMTIPADVLQRTGYRLPTEAEWEYACRAGTHTARYYGNSIDLLGDYAWYRKDDRDRVQTAAILRRPVFDPSARSGADDRDHPRPGGSLLPNDLGLFDMLGNVSEWCQDRWAASPPGYTETYTDSGSASEMVNEKDYRLLRGGSFYDSSAAARSAYRTANIPSYGDIGNGFRPARTCP
jgi:formylglycine-generating enzyme required for sulfatase activity